MFWNLQNRSIADQLNCSRGCNIKKSWYILDN